jgi:ATP-dependent DNA ligase
MTTPITAPLRSELLARLVFTGRAPARLPGIVTGLLGADDREYWPTHRDVVVEIATDGVADDGRWRHPVRALRLRNDRDPARPRKASK